MFNKSGTHFFFISNSVFNLSLELLTVFVKMRLKVASKLLGVIENPRLELLRIGKVEEHITSRPILGDTLGRCGSIETTLT